MGVNCYPIMYQNKKKPVVRICKCLAKFQKHSKCDTRKKTEPKYLDTVPSNNGRVLYQRLYITPNGALWRIFIALNITTPSTSTVFIYYKENLK
jgi:hypothetical protein